MEELNVKKVNFVSSMSEIVDYKIKPNFNSLNQKYGEEKSQIISFINSIKTEDLMLDLNKNKKVIFPDLNIELYAEDLIIEEIANKGCCLNSNNNAIVSIKTDLNKSLIDEGIVRDLIRKIQNLRKDSSFKVEDRISVSIISENNIYNAIDSYNEYFLSEILGIKLIKGSNNEKFKENFIIQKTEVQLGISVYQN